MSAPPLAVTLVAVAAALAAGAYVFAVLDAAAAGWIAGRRPHAALVARPLRAAAFHLLQQANETERPDAPAWRLAPALYLALAATGFALVPWSATFAPADPAGGIVFWGAVEALAIVAIFLHGWSANAPLPLLGAYRYVALGVSFLLVSMFVLIAAALPAESMRIGAIVASQGDLWNVVRQPLGLPLFLVVGLGLGFLGPLDFADASDLAGGTAAERSGAPRLVWETARASMLTAFAALAASVFLGGWTGPLLPGPLWLALKTLLVLALLAGLGRALARVGPERFVTFAWTVLLPVAFLHLALAGVEALA